LDVSAAPNDSNRIGLGRQISSQLLPAHRLTRTESRHAAIYSFNHLMFLSLLTHANILTDAQLQAGEESTMAAELDKGSEARGRTIRTKQLEIIAKQRQLVRTYLYNYLSMSIDLGS
jgi:hypothetical protein